MSKPIDNKVIDFFSGRPLNEIAQERIIRLAPENDGLCAVFTSDDTDDGEFLTMRIVAWGLRWNGDVVALVPWMNKLIACCDFNDDAFGFWEGYYDPATDDIFTEEPMHKVVELELSYAYCEPRFQEQKPTILQEIPDSIGTHALLLAPDGENLVLTELVSWRLDNEGNISGMLADLEKIQTTPVLMGDESLYAAQDNPRFRYYIQHSMANQIKRQDPETLDNVFQLLKRY